MLLESSKCSREQSFLSLSAGAAILTGGDGSGGGASGGGQTHGLVRGEAWSLARHHRQGQGLECICHQAGMVADQIVPSSSLHHFRGIATKGTVLQWTK